MITSGTASHQKALRLVLGLTLLYLVVEVIGGILTNSLSLLADAAHMLTDVGGIALALFAAWMSQKAATVTKTYGYYRFEILAALINGVVLFGTAFFILYEAIRRFQDPPEVISLPVLVVAVIGLIVNLIGVRVLHGGAEESLNVQGAFLEVVSDMLGSLGVIVAAGIMWLTEWYYADPIASVLISVLIFPRTWRLMSAAVNVLMEGVPAHLDLEAIRAAILSVDGVSSVHDLHVWTITSGIESLSAHILLDGSPDADECQMILERLQALLRESFQIDHTTIQIEFRDLQKQEPSL